jgi:hypothetical protein
MGEGCTCSKHDYVPSSCLNCLGLTGAGTVLLQARDRKLSRACVRSTDDRVRVFSILRRIGIISALSIYICFERKHYV